MGHKIIWCPPAGDSRVSFDSHQFADRKKFLSGSQLSYSDTQRLHVLRVGDRKPVRRTPTPAWAMNDESLREVLAAYLEGRLFIHDRCGTLQERLARCRAAAESQLPRKRAKLQEMVDAYRDLARLPETKPSALRLLERQIMNIDTDIFLAAKLPEVACSIVYLYHRLCWNSCSVAEHLGVKPSHVRQFLYRIGRAAQKMEICSARSAAA
jgi:hypothetical protein